MMDETEHLLSTPANAAELLASIRELDHELERLKALGESVMGNGEGNFVVLTCRCGEPCRIEKQEQV